MSSFAFGRVPPVSFPTEHGVHIAGQEQMENKALREQLEAQSREIHRLQGTVAHYRTWASQLQARYQLFNPDAARPAKRVYVGNLPSGVTEAELRQAVNELMVQCGGCSAPGFPIVSCKLYTAPNGTPGDRSPHAPGSASSQHHSPPSPSHAHHHAAAGPHSGGLGGSGGSGVLGGLHEKSYAFVEFRSVEEASNAMALDGVNFRDSYLKVRRPNNYDVNMALMLGPTEPNPAMDLSSLEVVRTVVQDSPHKLFIGGLPCDWTEEQVKEMLLPYGPLKAFNLVMDRSTGNSKGYAFCEYADVSVTDAVIQALNGKPIGNKFLTVKRALSPSPF